MCLFGNKSVLCVVLLEALALSTIPMCGCVLK